MTSPSSGGEPGGQRRADYPRSNSPTGVGRSVDPADDVQAGAYEDPETALGGADSVQKTSYVVGEGTEPAGAPRAGVVARTASGGGINVAAWVIGAIALAIALVYGFGVFR